MIALTIFAETSPIDELRSYGEYLVILSVVLLLFMIAAFIYFLVADSRYKKMIRRQEAMLALLGDIRDGTKEYDSDKPLDPLRQAPPKRTILEQLSGPQKPDLPAAKVLEKRLNKKSTEELHNLLKKYERKTRLMPGIHFMWSPSIEIIKEIIQKRSCPNCGQFASGYIQHDDGNYCPECGMKWGNEPVT